VTIVMEVDMDMVMEVDMDMVMVVIFNQMRNDLLSKWVGVAIDCHRSQVDAK